MLGIITYRRFSALSAMLDGLKKHCAQYPWIIAEDCGQRDGTADFLTLGRTPQPCPELMALDYVPVPGKDVRMPNARVLLGMRNLGVAGNSNRILKVFMDSGCDHLCLCNDDLYVLGDFVDFYGKGHQDLGVGLFCFCDFTHHPSYKWTIYPWRGYKLKFLPRFTGIMLSITRALAEKVGYFDTAFGQFGEEHCDFTIRCRMAGGIKLGEQDMNCLDLEHDLLKHQDVMTSVVGAARDNADREASIVMQQAVQNYRNTHFYRPYRLRMPRLAGGYRGGGIPVPKLLAHGYTLVTDLI